MSEHNDEYFDDLSDLDLDIETYNPRREEKVKRFLKNREEKTKRTIYHDDDLSDLDIDI